VSVKPSDDLRSRTGGKPREQTQRDRSSSTARCWIYSSFAGEPGGGNPAGVVLSSTALATSAAQAIAATLSAPATGFTDTRVVDVSFFTPE
jgi:predicted PhzF superfamily epimerase YddE/YHI9